MLTYYLLLTTTYYLRQALDELVEQAVLLIPEGLVRLRGLRLRAGAGVGVNVGVRLRARWG